MNEDMKIVLWVGGNKLIPGYGMGETNKEKLLPVKMADSYIQQGLAKQIKPKKEVR